MKCRKKSSFMWTLQKKRIYTDGERDENLNFLSQLRKRKKTVESNERVCRNMKLKKRKSWGATTTTTKSQQAATQRDFVVKRKKKERRKELDEWE
jgi:hypothetical protein